MRYAIVDHAQAYEDSMAGRHGEQLQLAHREGEGKDDPPYNPFGEEDFSFDDDDDDDDEEDDNDDDDNDKEKENAEKEGEEANALTLEDLQDDDMDDLQDVYNPDGSRRRLKSQLAALRAGAPAVGGIFAVIQLGGTQQKVAVDDLVIVNKLRPVEYWAVGRRITLTDDNVLLVGTAQKTLVGLPGVYGAQVHVLVEEITHDATMIIFHKKRRKNSKKRNGFRRQVTFLRILDIRMPEGTDAEADAVTGEGTAAANDNNNDTTTTKRMEESM